VHVARRTLPVVAVQPCDCGGVTKVIRELPTKAASLEIRCVPQSPSAFMQYKICTLNTVVQ